MVAADRASVFTDARIEGRLVAPFGCSTDAGPDADM
jgi:hypothetical protein